MNISPKDLWAAMDALEKRSGPYYGVIVTCNDCGWSGPMYMMWPPRRCPGMPRCCECKGDNTKVAVDRS